MALWVQQEWQPHSYTRSALDYYSQRPQDSGLSVVDVSFVVASRGEPRFAYLGAIVSDGKRADLKAYEIPGLCLADQAEATPSPAFDLFISEFERLMAQINGAVLLRDFLQFGLFSPMVQHMLREGAKLKTHTFQLIDLRRDDSELWRDVRRSYRSLINGGRKNLRLEFVEALSEDWAKMDAFRELHIRVAGRETRSIESWRSQYRWVTEGNAFLLLGWMDEELVTAGMFTFTSSMCTYFSSASRRDLFEKPMFHTLMWHAMLRAKALGCRWFDVNEKYFFNNPVVACEDEKLMSISDFKMGFGGQLKPVIDLELMRERAEEH
ncbi:MAG: hypothetical protein F9K30_00535 [Dechloromonas sp.]|nr:MAG: hypothetical protein F9K30_00535 [Dechloromonas sp.]